jgi:hypothetical protein
MADLDGFDAMIAEMASIVVKVDLATGDGVGDAAHYLEGQVKQLLSLTSHARGTPTPSPPGSPPSLISGALRRSVQVEGPRRAGVGQWTSKIAPEIVYAAVQEQGGGNNLPARPYMAPALATSLPAMGALIERAWAGALSD